MSIQKLYYKELTDNKVLMNVFDADNFLDHVGLTSLLSNTQTSKQGIDYPKVFQIMIELDRFYNQNSNQSITSFVENFGTVLFNICYETLLKSALSMQFRNFNSNDPGQNSYMSSNINTLLFKSALDMSDFEQIQNQILRLPDNYFAFTKSLVNFGAETDPAAIRNQVVELIVSRMYPALYFSHIQYQGRSCSDFKCKRVFKLATIVFVYYTLSSLFMLVFASQTSFEKFKVANRQNNDQMTQWKYKLVSMMDGALSLLENENILDVPLQNGQSKMADYYNELKGLSQDNVEVSTILNQKKKVAKIMQNNLNNYNTYQALSHATLEGRKKEFTAAAVIVGVIILAVISLLLVPLALLPSKFLIVNIVSGVAMLAIAIYALVGASRVSV
jgi:hypothetical protein